MASKQDLVAPAGKPARMRRACWAIRASRSCDKRRRSSNWRRRPRLRGSRRRPTPWAGRLRPRSLPARRPRGEVASRRNRRPPSGRAAAAIAGCGDASATSGAPSTAPQRASWAGVRHDRATPGGQPADALVKPQTQREGTESPPRRDLAQEAILPRSPHGKQLPRICPASADDSSPRSWSMAVRRFSTAGMASSERRRQLAEAWAANRENWRGGSWRPRRPRTAA